MKYLLLLFTLSSVLLQAQDQLDLQLDDWEANKCYVNHLLSNQDSSKIVGERYFKVIPPVWKTDLDTVYGQAGSKLRVLVEEEHPYFSLRRLSSFGFEHYGRYISICRFSFAPTYRIVSFVEGDTTKIVSVQRLVDGPKIIEISAAEAPAMSYAKQRNRSNKLPKWQSFAAIEDTISIGTSSYPSRLREYYKLRYFKLAAGNWSPKRIYNCSHCVEDQKGSEYIKRIQLKLIELGYKLEANNLMDAATKAALVDFQQKRGYAVGQLDLETLRALGIY